MEKPCEPFSVLCIEIHSHLHNGTLRLMVTSRNAVVLVFGAFLSALAVMMSTAANPNNGGGDIDRGGAATVPDGYEHRHDTPPLSAALRSRGTDLPQSTSPRVFSNPPRGDSAVSENHTSTPNEQQQRSSIWDSGDTAEFATHYQKTRCGAVVRNLCFKDGQPRYFTHSGALLTKSGATTMCNEAVRKSKLHMVVGSPPPAHAKLPYPLFRPPGKQSSSSSATSLLLIPFCWELYGYHLLLCIMSTWVNLRRVDSDHRAGLTSMQGRSVVGYLKGSGLFPYLKGSAADWMAPLSSSESRSLKSRPSHTTYWPLWRVLVDHPSQVMPQPDIPSRCFTNGVLGHIPSTDVTPAEQQAFRLALIRRVAMYTAAASHNLPSVAMMDDFSGDHFCKSRHPDAPVATSPIRVTIVERLERYRIKNLPDVKAAIVDGLVSAGAFHPSPPAARVVVLENMTLDEQMRVMVWETDVLVGVHGNGLSWSMLLPPTSVVLELWPNRPYNTNYATFALRGNLFYDSVSAHASCNARCGAAYPIADIAAAARRAGEHLNEVRCKRKPFDVTPQFFKAKEDAARRKAARAAEHAK